MKEVIAFLNANPMGSLATVEEGKPRVRPWGFMLEEDGRLWFCTANTKDVFRQLQQNPAVEFTATSKEMVTVRVRGEVKFSKDMAMKNKIIEHSPLVKSIYKTADNPVFEIFHLEHGKVVVADFSGQPPKVLEF
ncbi:MAG TPA: pyridoxamine 5'-phosphate oxidase family protein [Negativicutes bacterium]|nr:pyridoxamine 5'-phosphate oxidase family protein [Negativicutes bacterium]